MMPSFSVGSLNPVKVEAVKAIVTQYWPQGAVQAASVPSGVSSMPLSDTEMIEGARQRATAVRTLLQTTYGFGLEGGVHPEPFGWVLTGWVIVVDEQGQEGIGGCGRIRIPDYVVPRLQQGEELGSVMDELTNQHNIKQKKGAVGVFTAGLLTRQQAFEIGVACALAPFVASQFYTA